MLGERSDLHPHFTVAECLDPTQLVGKALIGTPEPCFVWRSFPLRFLRQDKLAA